MRVFAKKTFEFSNGIDTVKTNPLTFTDLPDWTGKTPLFKLASSTGDIEVIAVKKQAAGQAAGRRQEEVKEESKEESVS
jgi:hypothetical protein